MKVLVTGCAGFIGYHVTNRLLKEGFKVAGIDNLNDYYDVELKKLRLKALGVSGNESNELNDDHNFEFKRLDLNNRAGIEELFEHSSFNVVIHLGAQPGVRYSLENPHAYIDSNVSGFLNILEGCRHHTVDHLIYASSSSIYGNNKKVPFKTDEKLDEPVSLYAATKKANELMAYTYSHLYNIPSSGLRFFTVYGPWGRPDMAYFKFAERMKNNQQIDIYNNGEMYRDFTYVDDIVESIYRLMGETPENSKSVPYQLFNIGYGSPVNLMEFIEILETHLGIKAEKNFMPMQPGDVPRTWADTKDLQDLIQYKPQVSLDEGIGEFVKWYRTYRK